MFGSNGITAKLLMILKYLFTTQFSTVCWDFAFEPLQEKKNQNTHVKLVVINEPQTVYVNEGISFDMTNANIRSLMCLTTAYAHLKWSIAPAYQIHLCQT